MTADTLNEIFRVLYAYIAVVAWLFVVLYRTRPFYRSAAGWNYMLFQVTMAVLFTLLALPGEGAWRLWVWLVGLVMIALIFTHRVALIGYGIHRDRQRARGGV